VQPGSFGKLVQYFRLCCFAILPIPVAYCHCIFPYTLSYHLTHFSPVVLGNTNFDSIPQPLVTFIMSQCAALTNPQNSVSIFLKPDGNPCGSLFIFTLYKRCELFVNKESEYTNGMVSSVIICNEAGIAREIQNAKSWWLHFQLIVVVGSSRDGALEVIGLAAKSAF
jgi:hypothetical protein